jgi:excisionase family DNA binding protein
MGKKLTLDQAADELGTSLRTVRRLVSTGQLPAVKVGNSRLIRVDRDDLDKLLKPVTPNGKS